MGYAKLYGFVTVLCSTAQPYANACASINSYSDNSQIDTHHA